MKSCLLTIAFLFAISTTFAQTLSGIDLLEKSIAHHDPDGNWSTFKDELSIVMKTPNSSDRLSKIQMDFPSNYFRLDVRKDENRMEYTLNKEDCSLKLNGSNSFTEKEAETFRLSCDRAKMMKNYYTYLYGLPMKLKDPGTVIDPKVQTKTFKGKTYKVLKVTYEEGTGDDIWYFYFDPETYAMEVYQFYHDESKNDGEYILLSETSQVSGIKMPRIRAWYYNKDDKYLGTDILN